MNCPYCGGMGCNNCNRQGAYQSAQQDTHFNRPVVKKDQDIILLERIIQLLERIDETLRFRLK